MRIVLLGAGGAGRAIATQALLEKCPRLVIANRKGGRALELADHLRAQFARKGQARTEEDLQTVRWEDLGGALQEADLVVNATAAGLDPKEPSVLPARLLRSELLVYDTVYGAGSVKFRQEVETAGARWSDGLGMLLHQGAEAFSLWTRQEAPLEVMRQALQSVFAVAH